MPVNQNKTIKTSKGLIFQISWNDALYHTQAMLSVSTMNKHCLSFIYKMKSGVDFSLLVTAADIIPSITQTREIGLQFCKIKQTFFPFGRHDNTIVSLLRGVL